jgi:hypothetical protein
MPAGVRGTGGHVLETGAAAPRRLDAVTERDLSRAVEFLVGDGAGRAQRAELSELGDRPVGRGCASGAGVGGDAAAS